MKGGKQKICNIEDTEHFDRSWWRAVASCPAKYAVQLQTIRETCANPFNLGAPICSVTHKI